MSIRARSRMLSFRLSAEEYERFRDLCLAQGTRSVSEMGRIAINMLFNHPAKASQQAIESRLEELERRVYLLSFDVKRLNGEALRPGAGDNAKEHA